MIIKKISVLINITENDIIQVDTDLPNPFMKHDGITFSFETEKSKGVKYVLENLLPNLKEKPTVMVMDYKVRTLSYELKV